MTREIKFRVWNGMQMVEDVTVGKFGNFYVNPGPKGDGLDPNDSASLTRFTTKYPETCPVMQFTGLKDSKGKEIYEEDILYIAGVGNCRVVFSNACWAYENEEDLGFFNECEEDLILIGNMYEHPELLKQ